MNIAEIKNELHKLATKEAAHSKGQFFTSEQLEKDRFIGVKVPQIRALTKQYRALALDVCEELLQSPIHEERLLALLLLVQKYPKANENEKEKIVSIYLNNLAYIDQWDLIDQSAGYILGPFLEDKERKILYTLAKSPHWWERRISIIATVYFIKKNQYQDTLALAQILLKDPHDLVQKGVGWMLKEISERDINQVIQFLKKYATEMPRTMLRYAIEKFPEKERQHFLLSSKKTK